MKKQEPSINLFDQLQKIASEELDIPILKQRGRDSLDFHEVNVVSIRVALEKAYGLGKKSQSQNVDYEA